MDFSGEPKPILGDAPSLRGLLRILLENVIKHTTPGGEIGAPLDDAGNLSRVIEAVRTGKAAGLSQSDQATTLLAPKRRTRAAFSAG